MPLIPPNRILVFPLKDDLQWYDPDVVFQPFDDIFGRGVVGSTDLQVIQNGTPDGQISVKAGRGYVPYSSGGKRFFKTTVDIRSDAAEFVNAVPAWGGGNPRVHRIISKVRDATITPPDSLKGGVFDVLPGTATSGANLTNLSGAQSVPADSLLLGNVLQDGSTITTAKIDSSFGVVRAAARIGAGNTPSKTIKVNGASLTDRGALNLIAGTGITISAVDNSGADSADVTIAGSADLKLLMDYTVPVGGVTSIDTQVILGAALPTTYRSLLIYGYMASSLAGNDGSLRVFFNNNSNPNYDNGVYYVHPAGSGWVENLTLQGSGCVCPIPYANSTRFSTFEMVIPNYTITSLGKFAQVRAMEPLRYNSITLETTHIQGGIIWRYNAGDTDVPITRLMFAVIGGNIRENSRLQVYGI